MEWVTAVTAAGTLLTGVGALAAWSNAKAARHQTNGLLHEPLEQIKLAVLDTQVRITRVETKVDNLENRLN